MGRGNSDAIYFLEQHEQEIINCCRKGMSNNEVRQLLKTKYDREVAEDEIIAMKTSGATDASVRRWLAEEHEFEVSRATFSRFKKKYNLVDRDKDPRARNKEALTNRAIAQKQITDNSVYEDNIDMAIDTILQQQVTDIKTGLENLDKITKNAVGIEIDFEKLEREVRHNSNEKSLPRYLLDLEELKIRYLELSVKAFEAKKLRCLKRIS